MKRKAVRCAAADDEDFVDVFDSHVEEKKSKKEVAAAASATVGTRREDDENARAPESNSASSPTVKKKEKEFAWMDSEEEQEDAPVKVGNYSTENGAKDDDIGSDEENADVSAASLEDVQSFGRMMRLAPSLRKQLRGDKLGLKDVVAACRALARTKFFDGDIIQEMHSTLCTLLLGNKMDLEQTTDVIMCLHSLNAYDRNVFSSIARAFMFKTGAMEPAMRTAWLEVFKGFGHDVEKDFLQLVETPPLPPIHAGYRRLRCPHHFRGFCALDNLCTYSHDQRAPLSLVVGGNEDWWRSKHVVMTGCQKSMGLGCYGMQS